MGQRRFGLILFIGLLVGTIHYSRIGFQEPELQRPTTIPSVEFQPRPSRKDGALLPVEPAPWSASRYLVGQATPKFRDNLKPDGKYITTWLIGGWTNDVICLMNLIYLGILTSRIVILPPFSPDRQHIPDGSGYIPFGDIFDVQRLSEGTNTPIVEWRDVKNSSEREDIGCWSVWEVTGGDHLPRGASSLFEELGLDPSYTATSDDVQHYRGIRDAHCNFFGIAALSYPNAPKPPRPPRPNSVGSTLPPDEQLQCLDYIYWAITRASFEIFLPWSPVWNLVAKHAHWTAQTKAKGEAAVRVVFGLSEEDPIPPFIAIHARRGDFDRDCGETPRDECLATLPAFKRRVQEIRDELRVTKGVIVPESYVIMTSDEKDASWWAQIEQLGWKRVMPDPESYWGPIWNPLLVDVVVQSLAVGFVGTESSTLSLMAERRVQDWNSGVVRRVKHGRKDSDDH